MESARLEARLTRQIIEELDAGGKIGCEGAHLDPDLVPGALPRLPDWLPAFGQD